MLWYPTGELEGEKERGAHFMWEVIIELLLNQMISYEAGWCEISDLGVFFIGEVHVWPLGGAPLQLKRHSFVVNEC